MSEPLLVSLHIPKTAGSTLLYVLAERFGDKLQRAYHPTKPGLPRNDSDGWPDIPDPACIHGHGVLDRFPWVCERAEARWIAFIREPLAAAISLYNFQRKQIPWDKDRDQTGLERIKKTGFEEFLFQHFNHNRYQKRIARSGKKGDDFFLIGITERFDDSMWLLYRRLGWAPIYYPMINQGSYSLPEIDRKVKEEFMRLNHEDYVIYQRALQKLEEGLESYGSAGEQERDLFQSQLQAWQKTHRSVNGRWPAAE